MEKQVHEAVGEMGLYEAWDNCANKNTFQVFAVGLLMSDCGFTKEQASLIIDDIITTFVDDADALQREMAMDRKPDIVLRQKIDELLYDEEGDKIPLIAGMKQKLFGAPRAGLSNRLASFLDKEDAEEAVRLFGENESTGAKTDDESRESCDSLLTINSANLDVKLSLGETARTVLTEFERSIGDEGRLFLDNCPRCFSSALMTDLLSGEENLLKKLVALDCFVKAMRMPGFDDEKGGRVNPREVAPVVAVETCRLAYREVVSAKTAYKQSQLLALTALVNAENR